jgi:hypothetical protein
MTFISNRRVVATIVAASCIAVPASASADALPSTYKSDAAQSGGAYSLPSTYKSDAAQSGGDAGNRADAKLAYPPGGFTGGDIAQSERTATSTYPPSGFSGGDNPADRVNAPTAAPMTIEVVRPERTIVRDVDEALPLILSGSALLLVLAGLGFTLTRNGIVPRLGRSD